MNPGAKRESDHSPVLGLGIPHIFFSYDSADARVLIIRMRWAAQSAL